MKSSKIDLGLAVIESLRPAHVRLSLQDIAEICECSKSFVLLIEQTAMKKLRAAAKRLNDTALPEAGRNPTQTP